MHEADTGYDFEVALSFAGEDREYVREVREQLEVRQRRCFYDEDYLEIGRASCRERV